jgi:hypothetical protein
VASPDAPGTVPRLRAVEATLAVGAVALVAAACGGGNPGVATLGNGRVETSTAAAPVGSPASGPSRVQRQTQLLKLAACMRKYGVANFPDPVNGSLILRAEPVNGLDPFSPQFQGAQKACRSLEPQLSPAQQQQSDEDALKLSQCMRAHGVPNFPDPTLLGGGKTELTLPPGLNANSRQLQAAQSACGFP